MRKLVEVLYFSDPISLERLEEQVNKFLQTAAKDAPDECWEAGPMFATQEVPPDGESYVEYIQVLHRYVEVAK